MGASSELYAQRMRGPEPDEGDLWILQIAEVMRAKRERHTQRHERIMAALAVTTHTMEDEVVFL